MRGGLVQVNYFPSRYDPVRHAENYPTPPAVCYVKRGGPCIIEKENNFKESRDCNCKNVGRWIDALSPPPITHEICSIWISYRSQADKSLGQKLASRLNVRPSI
ncbi:Catalase-2 [Raphanus sativus]|nr:Catalase-2 [Raphanus sativus]